MSRRRVSPSLLPGWSRAHVASHISRNADALRRVIAAARDGEPAPLYPSSAAKFNDIERGSERSGLELHVDLDTSAGELANLCERVEDWLVPVRLIGGEFPLSVVTLIRLHELTLHHLDLIASIQDAETAFRRSARAERSSVSMLVGGAFIHRPSPSSSASAIRSGSVALGTRRTRSASNGVAVFALMIFRISPDSKVVS